MGDKYRVLIIFLLFFLLGVGISIINRFYSFNYLYNLLTKREYAINSKAEIIPDKIYQISIWYYPFFRTIEGEKMGERAFFKRVTNDLQHKYPNIQLKIRRLNFLDGRVQLLQALEEGNPPDIYFNLTNDSLIDRKWQIPIEAYLDVQEKAEFYSLDWNTINTKNHLWGWPFLVQQQGWLVKERSSILEIEKTDFLTKITRLDKGSLLLNYQDLTLLRQILSLKGLEKIEIKGGEITEEFYQILEETFSWFYDLSKKGILASSTINMDAYFLKGFLGGKAMVIGPVNPWLESFLLKKGQGSFCKINLQNLVQLYTLSIFYQKNYQGDDHTRAVMEVARIIVEGHAGQLAEKLGMKGAYKELKTEEDRAEDLKIKKILELSPELRKFWEKELIPAWMNFWNKGLTPKEVMSELKK